MTPEICLRMEVMIYKSSIWFLAKVGYRGIINFRVLGRPGNNAGSWLPFPSWRDLPAKQSISPWSSRVYLFGGRISANSFKVHSDCLLRTCASQHQRTGLTDRPIVDNWRGYQSMRWSQKKFRTYRSVADNWLETWVVIMTRNGSGTVDSKSF